MIVQGKLLTDPAQPPELGWLEIESVEGVGRIKGMGFGELPADFSPPTVGGRDRIVCPAFTDAHMHVPQIDSVGIDGLELLAWLNTAIFPAEAWWGHGGAVHHTKTAVRRLLREGTVGIAGYLSSHAEGGGEAIRYLANRTPMRFHVGRSAMDRHAPAELLATDLERPRLSPMPSPVLHLDGEDHRRRVSANPRFAVSCTPELMAEVAWAVRARDQREGASPTVVQTHLSESLAECALIRELFPEEPHYTAVYDRAGLLGPQTLLAHAIHLSDEERALIAERDAVIVHCPTANTFLQAGLFDLDAALAAGIRVGLGSDIAGGPDAAMPRVARGMIEVAKVRRLTAGDPKGVRIPTPAEMWRTITKTNAELLGWHDAGELRVGAMADVLVLRTPETWHDRHLIGRLLYNWSSSLIEHRIADGAVVDPATIGVA